MLGGVEVETLGGRLAVRNSRKDRLDAQVFKLLEEMEMHWAGRLAKCGSRHTLYPAPQVDHELRISLLPRVHLQHLQSRGN